VAVVRRAAHAVKTVKAGLCRPCDRCRPPAGSRRRRREEHAGVEPVSQCPGARVSSQTGGVPA
jgi:hypothetical protein